MALVSIGQELLGLTPYAWSLGANGTIDATGERIGYIFEVPATGNIDRVTFRTNAVTTSETLRAGLYTIDASGDPTATQYAGSGFGTQATPAATTTYEVTLGTPAAATMGNVIALVVEFDSAIGNLSFPAVTALVASGFPYIDLFTGTWAHTTSQFPVCGIRYDSGIYYDIGCIPGNIAATSTFNSGSTPDEIGNIWTPAFDCRISGFWGLADFDNALDVVLYDTDGTTALQTRSVVAANRGSTGQAQTRRYFATPQVLAAGSAYRLVLKPGAGNIAMHRLTLLAAAAMGGMPLGTAMFETSRVNAGAWTETAAQRISIGPIIDQLDNGAGGGGGGGILAHSLIAGGG